MRRILLVAALVAAGSCGGSPAGPTPATTPAEKRPVVLGSGSYTLTMTLSTTGTPSCQNGICTSSSVCVNSPGSKTASFDVVLEQAETTAIVRIPDHASSLALSLVATSDSVSGTITGSARDATGVLFDVSGAVTGAAPPNPAIAVSGNIDGQMSAAGGGCTNNGHTWSLTRR